MSTGPHNRKKVCYYYDSKFVFIFIPNTFLQSIFVNYNLYEWKEIEQLNYFLFYLQVIYSNKNIDGYLCLNRNFVFCRFVFQYFTFAFNFPLSMP